MNKVIKNRLLLIVLAIAVFVPTLVMFVNYNREKDGPATAKTVASITVADLNGTSYVLHREEATGAAMIQLFLNINDNAIEAGELPEPLRTQSFYLVTMSNGSTETAFQYYFDLTGTESYYMNGDGRAYKISESDAKNFLKTAFAASLYPASELPTLTLLGEQSGVKPKAALWKYKDIDGNEMTAETGAFITSEKLAYAAEGSIAMDFSVEPDLFSIVLKDAATGNTVYEGAYKDLSYGSLTGGETFNVDVTAKWDESSDRENWGEVSYSFVLNVSAPAEFYLSVDSVNAGEFVCVTGKNVSDLSKISFKSEPEVGFTPTFYKDGDYVLAFVPISLTSVGGDQKFSLTYGGVTKDLSLKVNPKTYRASEYKAAADKAALYSDINKNAASDALISIFTSGSDVKYFDDTTAFTKVFEDNAINRYYGRSYTISGTQAVFRQEGVEYKAAEGTDVKATAAGIVVYVGSTNITGNIVIIEHGWGLKTVYGHLSSATVKVGDEVALGGVVGKCGSTGFANQAGVYFGMYVGTTPVCPYATWIDGDWKGIPLYKG